jgi:uncharacterized membrane protein
MDNLFTTGVLTCFTSILAVFSAHFSGAEDDIYIKALAFLFSLFLLFVSHTIMYNTLT